MWVFSPKRHFEPIKRPVTPAPEVKQEAALSASVFVEPAAIAPEVPVEPYAEAAEPVAEQEIAATPQIVVEPEPEAEPVLALLPRLPGFIETETGFLRLDLVQRFEVWEHPSGAWHVSACVDQFASVSVGEFKSKDEARQAVIRMIDGEQETA